MIKIAVAKLDPCRTYKSNMTQLPYIALEALALIYLFWLTTRHTSLPQCIPPGCISFSLVTSSATMNQTCSPVPTPPGKFQTLATKSGKTVGLTTLYQMFLEFWFCLTFSGFPATIFWRIKLYFLVWVFLISGDPRLDRNTVVKLCRLHCCISCGQMYLCLASKGQQPLIHPGKFMAGSQSHGGDFEDDFAFSIG